MHHACPAAICFNRSNRRIRYLSLYSPRGFRSIQRTITGLGGVRTAPCVGERVELRLAHLPARFAKQDIVIGVRVKRRIEIQDRHSPWEIPSDRKASEDCHRNKGDYYSRTA